MAETLSTLINHGRTYYDLTDTALGSILVKAVEAELVHRGETPLHEAHHEFIPYVLADTGALSVVGVRMVKVEDEVMEQRVEGMIDYNVIEDEYGITFLSNDRRSLGGDALLVGFTDDHEKFMRHCAIDRAQQMN